MGDDDMEKKNGEPTERRRPPKLPPGATFTPTRFVTKNEEGKWVDRRLVAQNHERRQMKALGLSRRQLKRARVAAMKQAAE